MNGDSEPTFVDVDSYNVITTCEAKAKQVLIRPMGMAGANITLEGHDTDEVLARFSSLDDADDAYSQAMTACTLGDVISILKLEEQL